MTLLRVQCRLLVTKRVIVYVIIISVLSLLYGILTSEVFSHSAYQLFFKAQLKTQYTQDILTFLKLMMSVSVIFLLMHGVLMNHYDELFVGRQPKWRFISSKLLILLIVLGVILFIVFSILMIIGILTHYYRFTLMNINVFIHIYLLGVYYLLLGSLLYHYLQHIIAFIIPLMAYLVVFITTDPFIQSNALTPQYFVLHIIFPDILVNGSFEPYFVYGISSVIILILTVFIHHNWIYAYRVVTHKKD